MGGGPRPSAGQAAATGVTGVRNTDLHWVKDRHNSIALAADECLRVPKGIVVGLIFNTCPLERVGDVSEDASVS